MTESTEIENQDSQEIENQDSQEFESDLMELLEGFREIEDDNEALEYLI